MAGAGSSADLAAPYKDPQSDVKFWSDGNWLPLAPGAKNFGPEVSFGRAIKDAMPNDDIYLVKYGSSGSALYNDWAPTNGRCLWCEPTP